MDFVADQLFDGRKFRALTIVDNFSRFCLGIRVGKSIKGIDVVEVLEALKINSSYPDLALGVAAERKAAVRASTTAMSPTFSAVGRVLV